MSGRWLLTGRAEELRFIAELTRRRDGPAGVVLAGAAGVGKTRLARDALAAAEQDKAMVRWAVATTSARSLPLGAFAPMLGAVGTADPTRLLRQVSDALLAGAGHAGVVIGVDDAHLLDELSALLVHELALRRAATVVLTLRTGEPAPDPVTALWKDGYLARLELRPLSREDTATLLEAVLAGPVHSAAVRELWSITRGNVLYLRQLVDGELESGRLHQTAGVWQWSGRPRLSPGLAELVQMRMGRLPDEQREPVEILAFGEPLGVSLLTRLTSAAAVEQAEAHNLIEVAAEGRRLQARLAHPLYGEVQRARIGQLRARRLRGRIASALASTGGRRAGDTMRRATLALDSDLPADPELLTAAAHGAAALIDLPLAERLAREAIAAGGGFAPRLTLASVVIGLARGGDSELASLTEHARSGAEHARATVLRVASLAWMLSRPAEAEAVLSAAEAAAVDGDARAELAALRAMFDAYLGRPGRALQAAAAALAAPGLSDQGTALACLGLVTGLGMVARADGIGAVVARGLAAAARSVDAAWLSVPLVGQQVFALRLAGYPREAHAVVLDCRERFSVQALSIEISSFLLGYVELARGRLGASLRFLREARAGLADFNVAGGWLFACQVELTRALAIAGHIEAARRALAELQDGRHPGFVCFYPEMILARAWVAAAEGAVSAAVTLAREAAGAAAAAGQRAHEVVALQAAVCFGDRTVAGRLAELAAGADGPRAAAAAAHAAALAADDGAALQAASARLEEMGDLLVAADAAAQAAAAHARRGRRGAAQAAAARAHRLARACDGPRTPALAGAASLPLTAREREIVSLAAEGLSNREIAERLVVSVRTVEGHLYRACAKLGTSSRAQLATLLHGD